MSVFDSGSYIEFLKNELDLRIRQNSRYSLRAFARDLGVSPGAISEILSGKRPLTGKNAAKIAKNLGLNRVEEEALMNLPQRSKKQQVSLANKHQLSLEYFKAIETWYHFAILNLFDSVPKPGTVKEIATRLGINYIEAKLALDRLEKLGLVVYFEGTWQASKERVETPADIPSMSIRKYHHQVLQKAMVALNEQSPEERDISGIGMAIDPANMKAIKKDISEFQDKMMEKYSGVGKASEVYQMELAFFKLTKSGGMK